VPSSSTASPSSLRPTSAPSPRPSKSLSPHTAPFHPGGISVGRSKACRWADADLGAGSFDDEPTPAATRPSYLDATCKALRAMPPPPTGSSNMAQSAATMVACVPAQRRLGPQPAVRASVHQRLGPRRRASGASVPNTYRHPHQGPNVDADGF
jgi:hypothetical protein